MFSPGHLQSRLRGTTRHVATVGLTALALTVGFAGGRSGAQLSAQAQTAAARVVDAAPMPATGSYSHVVDRVAPAVVTIRVEQRLAPTNTQFEGLPEEFREFFGRRMPQQAPRGGRQSGLGSGVIVRPDGYILTNNHVIDGAERIQVEFADKRMLSATVVGTDPASDLAVLKIEANGLPTLGFGNSDQVKVGDVVLAFGDPLGVGPTVTMGIVSAKGRATGVGDGSYEDFLQTDAPINRGNSGGALVNLRGELVGINAQILSPSGGNIGLGFAIPASMANAVTDQLIKDGVVRRSKLGVLVQPVTWDLAKGLGLTDVRGALVSEVEPGSPAAHAGLRQGDVITELDGRQVADSNALRNQVAGTRPGSVSLTVVRNGKPEQLTARLVEREQEKQASSGTRRSSEKSESTLGMTVRPVTPDVAQELELPKSASGLVVTDVDPSGAAADAGIRPGDVIGKVNGTAIASVADLRAALSSRDDRPAVALVTRQGRSLFVPIPMPRS